LQGQACTSFNVLACSLTPVQRLIHHVLLLLLAVVVVLLLLLLLKRLPSCVLLPPVSARVIATCHHATAATADTLLTQRPSCNRCRMTL